MTTAALAALPGVLRRHAMHVVLACGILSATGCVEALLSPPQYATIRVVTSTTDGVPVPDVHLTLYTGQRPIEYAASGENGEYLFERVVPGNYGVLALFPDEFRDPTESPYVVRDAITVERGIELMVTLTQARCLGSVLLTVRDSAGQPGSGIPATLYDSRGDVQQSVTSAAGTARFDALTCHAYGVKLGASSACTITAGRGSSYVDDIQVTRLAPTPAITLTVASCASAVTAPGGSVP